MLWSPKNDLPVRFWKPWKLVNSDCGGSCFGEMFVGKHFGKMNRVWMWIINNLETTFHCPELFFLLRDFFLSGMWRYIFLFPNNWFAIGEHSCIYVVFILSKAESSKTYLSQRPKCRTIGHRSSTNDTKPMYVVSVTWHLSEWVINLR